MQARYAAMKGGEVGTNSGSCNIASNFLHMFLPLVNLSRCSDHGILVARWVAKRVVRRVGNRAVRPVWKSHNEITKRESAASSSRMKRRNMFTNSPL